MEVKKKIVLAIENGLKELNLPETELELEHPENPEHGDYSSNIAMAIFSNLKFKEQNAKLQLKIKKYKSPLELAEEIKSKLWSNETIKQLCQKIEIVSPGFINFWLAKDYLSKQLVLALNEDERYFTNKSLSDKTWMVEFAHPNTHKEFHIGHLRNITLGESLCRLFGVSGAAVVRANYQGDVGLHIAKAIWGLKKLGKKIPTRLAGKISLLAKAYVLGSKRYEENPNVKKEVEEINKKLYQEDPEIKKIWQETRGWSLLYFETIYKRLGTKFDRLYFESEVSKPGLDIVNKYLDTVFEKSEGAVIFPGKKFGLHNRVFINKLGLPTYEAKDMGLAYLQFEEFNPDKIIHVVGPEQTSYFQVIFSALGKILPASVGKEFHLSYGWVRLKRGKMSSRTGEVIVAIKLISEIKKRIKTSYQTKGEIAEQIAVGAVKYSMLRLRPSSEIAFDIDESISMDGDSGPYLQYTFVRARSVLSKAQSSKVKSQNYSLNLKTEKLQTEELDILRTFYRFPEVIETAAQQFAPNLICNFLFDLASKYNLMYNNLPILEPKGDKQHAIRDRRLALTRVTANILKTGLGLLGIAAPERM